MEPVVDEAIPPPIRRSSRQSLRLYDSDDADEAAPPPITRSRSASRCLSISPRASSCATGAPRTLILPTYSSLEDVTQPPMTSTGSDRCTSKDDTITLEEPANTPARAQCPPSLPRDVGRGTPMSVPQRRSSLLNSATSPQQPVCTPSLSAPLPTTTHSPLHGSPVLSPGLSKVPPMPCRSPLRSCSLAEGVGASSEQSRNFSHPFRNPSTISSARPRRCPSKNKLHLNKRLPLRLRRWSSLETIDSVRIESPSVQEETPRFSIETSTSEFPTLDEEGRGFTHQSTPLASSEAQSSDTMSYRADSISASSNRFNNSAISVFRKLKARKLDEPFLEPVHLEISKKISFDQRSERTRSSSSNMTISSGRLSKISPPISDKRSDSVSSKDWKSSEYDTSWLREADLKKCKKKGINPALYAEMKAARKGKWMSPIVGNIIL